MEEINGELRQQVSQLIGTVTSKSAVEHSPSFVKLNFKTADPPKFTEAKADQDLVDAFVTACEATFLFEPRGWFMTSWLLLWLPLSSLVGHGCVVMTQPYAMSKPLCPSILSTAKLTASPKENQSLSPSRKAQMVTLRDLCPSLHPSLCLRLRLRLRPKETKSLLPSR